MPGRFSVGDADQLAEADSNVDHRLGVGFPFGLVGIEEIRRRLGSHHFDQLPGQIGGIPYSGTHSLSEEGRCLMGGVSSQQDPAVAPPRGHQSVKGVNGRTFDLRPPRVDPRGHQRFDHLGAVDVLFGLAGQQHELEAEAWRRHRHQRVGTGRVAHLEAPRR